MTDESKNYVELNAKILAKNLEITKLTKELDKCASEVLDMKEKLSTNPGWMISHINATIDQLEKLTGNHTDESIEFCGKLKKIAIHLSANGSALEHTNDK